MQTIKLPKLWWLKFVVAALCIVADYLSKEWARNNLPAYGASVPVSIPVFDQCFHFALCTNTGGPFSLASGHAIVMTVVATSMTLLWLLWILKEERAGAGLSINMSLGAGFLVGGAIGNLIDRFVRHQVTDFIQFTPITFPIFNVADICIDIGIALILISSLRKSSAQENQMENEDPGNDSITT